MGRSECEARLTTPAIGKFSPDPPNQNFGMLPERREPSLLQKPPQKSEPASESPSTTVTPPALPHDRAILIRLQLNSTSTLGTASAGSLWNNTKRRTTHVGHVSHAGWVVLEQTKLTVHRLQKILCSLRMSTSKPGPDSMNPTAWTLGASHASRRKSHDAGTCDPIFVSIPHAPNVREQEELRAREEEAMK